MASDTEHMEDEPLEREVETGIIPDWYRDIYPDGERDGFYEKIGAHSLCYVERNLSQLVITFDNLAEAGHEGYDREAWASGFCNYNNWSHMGIFAQGPTWFRDERLIRRLEKLRDDGFFEQFGYVALAGASMGGFAAMVFSALIPEATVIAFSPQTSLSRDIVPWETRFRKGHGADWTLPYSDAVPCIESANKVYIVYDQFEKLDNEHAKRLSGDNVIHLRAPAFGHRTSLFLRRLDVLKPVMGEGVLGTLDAARFSEMIRDRGKIWLYRTVMEHHLLQRGLDDWVPIMQDAFKHRRWKIKQAEKRAERRAEKRA
ncbi:hypothetical protein [Amylibacter sp. IMCC11727]|uniref:hypothetical protein n=1 Tax=Amylibacter sp. IMCC11727 TaxID=3039851 RepID=UPI00244DCF9A|nr:hypothetical protein [Amylibacter sp. IMCC11727]WGI22370.1 hypothetical protein QBD29_02840 [Amylibacter sp. IMCC11727]